MENSRLAIEQAYPGNLSLRAEDRELTLHGPPPFPAGPGFPSKQFTVAITGSGRRAWGEHICLSMEQARTLAAWLIENLCIEPPPPNIARPRWLWRRAAEWLR